MRILFAMLVFAATAAFASDVSFDQANALAAKDSASLDGDQTLALVQSQSKASDAMLKKCPRPVRKADFAAFVVVMELDATGKVTRTWLQGTTSAAECFNKEFAHQTLSFKPPHAPFYASYDMHYQQ